MPQRRRGTPLAPKSGRIPPKSGAPSPTCTGFPIGPPGPLARGLRQRRAVRTSRPTAVEAEFRKIPRTSWLLNALSLVPAARPRDRSLAAQPDPPPIQVIFYIIHTKRRARRQGGSSRHRGVASGSRRRSPELAVVPSHRLGSRIDPDHGGLGVVVPDGGRGDLVDRDTETPVLLRDETEDAASLVPLGQHVGRDR